MSLGGQIYQIQQSGVPLIALKEKNAHVMREPLDYWKAIEAYAEIQGENPSNDFWFDYALAYYQLGLLTHKDVHFVKAAELMESFIAEDPFCCEGWAALGEIYTQLFMNTADSRYAELGNDCFLSAISLDPMKWKLWLARVQLLTEYGKLQKSEKILQEAVAVAEEALDHFCKYAEIRAAYLEANAYLYGLKESFAKLAELESIAEDEVDQNPNKASLWNALGVVYTQQGSVQGDSWYWEDAVEVLEKALQLDSSCFETLQALAGSYRNLAVFCEDGALLLKALEYYQKGIALKPTCSLLSREYVSSLLLACEWDLSEDLAQKAVIQASLLKQDLQGKYSYALALSYRGECNGDAADLWEAIFLFKELDSEAFSDIDYRLALCYSYLASLEEDTGLLGISLGFFEKAYQQNSEDDKVCLEWGITLAELGLEIEDPSFYVYAEQKIKEAGSLGNQYAYYHLAALYSLMEKYEESLALLKKAEELDLLPPLEIMTQDTWLEGLFKKDKGES